MSSNFRKEENMIGKEMQHNNQEVHIINNIITHGKVIINEREQWIEKWIPNFTE